MLDSPRSGALPTLCTCLALCLGLAGCAAGSAALRGTDTSASPSEPERHAVIQNTGSDTMLNLALAWAEAYREVAPDVDVAVTGGGTGTGVAGLLGGTVDMANASRALKAEEFGNARRKGFTPIEHRVAVDALAVIVHTDNTVGRLTIPQLADIFTGRARNWAEFGGHDAPIVPVSRESNSGTHVYFLERVIRRGDGDNEDIFAAHTLLMPSSVGITSEVRRNPNAIGYDGLGYVSPDSERILAIAPAQGESFVMPSVASAADGSYPLARPLFIDTTDEPTPAVAAYLAWIQSAEGQAIVRRLGFVPVEAGMRGGG